MCRSLWLCACRSSWQPRADWHVGFRAQGAGLLTEGCGRDTSRGGTCVCTRTKPGGNAHFKKVVAGFLESVPTIGHLCRAL
eukprot:5613601-Prymnesium_polylepis.1